MPVRVRVPRYVTVCGRRVSVPEAYISYGEKALAVDVVDYCERPEAITFSMPDDYDGWLFRFGVRRINSVWVPALRRARSCFETGRRWRNSFYVWLHYTLRYCQRSGSDTRNITVDFRIARRLDEEYVIREYFRWLRRNGVTMKCLRKTPETTQRRLVMMFWVYLLTREVQALWRRMETFLTRCFFALPFLGFEDVEGITTEKKLPPLQVAYIAWGVTRRSYLENWVYGMYCRCDQTGMTSKCKSVLTPYTRCML